ncbi:efflux RND transporter periplasmic adaptor subunit [Marinomonas ostreistagni]|uniref:efflux RND transporter periplasmic adaptor subunit n=1 Tax=Marinomonas ostreistagni TaxID=359209 RepID=UPI00194F6821|nr:efflux RND transporter periplasmic adaptor subunit [Marinomonas ostreistagni]MBM6550952.1 efflux RND transporter periplasmic adaptor subunit [Marinomonas ostreistagni]
MTFRRSWLTVSIWLLVLGIPAATGAWYVFAQQDAQPSWRTEPIVRGDIEISVAGTGTLEPSNYVDVGAQVSGQIETLYVEEGDEVQQGQLLAEIDATVFEIDVNRSQASLENQKAQLAQLEAQLELSNTRIERDRRLHQRGAVSDDALQSAETDIVILKARIAAIEAQIKASQAALDGDVATLSYSRIYAPIDGTVSSIEVRVGQTLNANQSAPTLMTISSLKQMTLRADVSEADIHKLSEGMAVRFSTLGNPDVFYHSTLNTILPTPSVNNDVVLYQVLIDVDNQAGKLMDGMSTQVFFIQEQAEDVLMAPLASIAQRPRGSLAFVPGANGERASVKVETGIQNRTHIEITSGLEAGDLVISGNQNAPRGNQASSLTGNRPPMGGRRGN